MLISVRRPSGRDLHRWLVRAHDQEVTYAEVGETGASVLPPGYRHERVSVSVGQGDTAFARCRQAIKMWQGHRYVGATLAPATPEIAVGVDVIVCLQIGPMFVVAPCRIVVVTDEADVFGFSYGTLPGHPERGEEAFHARRTEGGEVTSRSRPSPVPATRWCVLAVRSPEVFSDAPPAVISRASAPTSPRTRSRGSVGPLPSSTRRFV